VIGHESGRLLNLIAATKISETGGDGDPDRRNFQRALRLMKPEIKDTLDKLRAR
jgi:hypothetical protein